MSPYIQAHVWSSSNLKCEADDLLLSLEAGEMPTPNMIRRLRATLDRARRQEKEAWDAVSPAIDATPAALRKGVACSIDPTDPTEQLTAAAESYQTDGR